MDDSFDPAYQKKRNGELTPALRARLKRFHTLGYSLAEIGAELGFSGSFAGAIMRKDNPAKVRSKHIPRILKVLEEAEVNEGIAPPKQVDGSNSKRLSDYSVEELLLAVLAKLERHKAGSISGVQQ